MQPFWHQAAYEGHLHGQHEDVQSPKYIKKMMRNKEGGKPQQPHDLLAHVSGPHVIGDQTPMVNPFVNPEVADSLGSQEAYNFHPNVKVKKKGDKFYSLPVPPQYVLSRDSLTVRCDFYVYSPPFANLDGRDQMLHLGDHRRTTRDEMHRCRHYVHTKKSNHSLLSPLITKGHHPHLNILETPLYSTLQIPMFRTQTFFQCHGTSLQMSITKGMPMGSIPITLDDTSTREETVLIRRCGPKIVVSLIVMMAKLTMKVMMTDLTLTVLIPNLIQCVYSPLIDPHCSLSSVLMDH